MCKKSRIFAGFFASGFFDLEIFFVDVRKALHIVQDLFSEGVIYEAYMLITGRWCTGATIIRADGLDVEVVFAFGTLHPDF